MRQRVALIRTLAVDPDILLLDEPFSSLDYQTRLLLSDEIYNIIKKEGKTVIMVTHDIAEAVSMSDRIIVLTKRPATVKNIYNIELENKANPTENRKNKDFMKFCIFFAHL
jgi:NitT/TauT family transport system ATP-binding protein